MAVSPQPIIYICLKTAGRPGYCFHNENPEHIALYEDIKKKDLENLYALSRQMGNRYKMIISVFQESSIMSQLKIQEKDRMDVEVCTPTFSRLYSAWTKGKR